MEKSETMQKIKDINKLENRDKDITLYEHGENIKNNQEKGIVTIFNIRVLMTTFFLPCLVNKDE